MGEFEVNVKGGYDKRRLFVLKEGMVVKYICIGEDIFFFCCFVVFFVFFIMVDFVD